MRVVLSGIFYPMAILRYFEAALKRRKDVELYTVGPYTGQMIPWNGGMLLPKKYATPPTYPLDVSPGIRVPTSWIERSLPWTPNVWIQIDAGFHFVGKPVCENIIIGTDPHAINYNDVRPFADVFYCMQTPYAQTDDVWLPYAYDPVWHAPDLSVEKTFDVGLIGAYGGGAHYEPRKRLAEALRAKGFKVLTPGYGPCFDEYRSLLNSCKIGFNFSTAQDTTARVFETMAMNVCLLTNRTPDLAKLGFVEDRDYIGFDDINEAVSKVEAVLGSGDDVSRYKEIADAGHLAVQPHTWDERVRTLIG